MRQTFKGLLFVAMTFLVVACGDKTSVNTGEVGKILGTQGLEAEILRPSTFRMDYCGTGACPKLVRLEVNKAAVDVNIDSLFLPNSNVDLTEVTAGIQFRVKQDEASINAVYAEVKPAKPEQEDGDSGRVLIITAEKVWETFGSRKAPDAIIAHLRELTVEEVLTNVPEIAAATKERVNIMLKDTPIEVTELGFPNGIGEVPELVIESKRSLFAIEDEKAREIKSLQAALVIEGQRQAVARMRARNDAEIAKGLGISVAQYQCLRSFDRFADAADEQGSASIAVMGDCGLSASSARPTVMPILQWKMPEVPKVAEPAVVAAPTTEEVN